MRFLSLRPRAHRALLAVLCLGSAAVLVLVGPAALARAQTSARVHFLPRPYGVALGLDRAYYPEGATARVSFLMQNDTARDAHGWCGVRGGNGCTFQLTIEDLDGNVVSGPGSGCFFAATPQPLPAGSRLERDVVLPLVHRNSPLAADGTPLAAGAYRVCFELCYSGPQPLPGAPTIPGSDPLVCVPIQIEP